MEVSVIHSAWVQIGLYFIIAVITATGAVIGSSVGTKAEARRIWDQVMRSKEDISKLELMHLEHLKAVRTDMRSSLDKLDAEDDKLHDRINRLRDEFRPIPTPQNNG